VTTPADDHDDASLGIPELIVWDASDGTPAHKELPSWAIIGDRVDVVVETRDTACVVDPAGEIDLPGLGIVQVAGLTAEEIAAKLESGLERLDDAASVQVEIVRFERGYRISGDVAREGPQELIGEMTVEQAVARALPGERTADLEHVWLLRADASEHSLLCYRIDLTTAHRSAARAAVHDRDCILVPVKSLDLPDRARIPGPRNLIARTIASNRWASSRASFRRKVPALFVEVV
jgi:protein involved in polysaccharide export with SLBB domain